MHVCVRSTLPNITYFRLRMPEAILDLPETDLKIRGLYGG